MNKISIAQLKREITGSNVSFVTTIWDLEERISKGTLLMQQVIDLINSDTEVINTGVTSFTSRSMVRCINGINSWYQLEGATCQILDDKKGFILDDGRTACVYKIVR